jgi:hypothetical protein
MWDQEIADVEVIVSPPLMHSNTSGTRARGHEGESNWERKRTAEWMHT